MKPKTVKFVRRGFTDLRIFGILRGGCGTYPLHTIGPNKFLPIPVAVVDLSPRALSEIKWSLKKTLLYSDQSNADVLIENILITVLGGKLPK